MDATNEVDTCDTEALNTLLRGELAAVETYTQALGMFDDEVVIVDLQKIRDEHSRAVRTLRDEVIRFGGLPAEKSGVWGSFTALATGTAKAIGPATTLAALRSGEEHGVSGYQAALDETDVHPDCQRAIRSALLPACREHIDDLNRLLGGSTR
jgi:bacterioferritin (cytochrome b1)